MLNKGDMQNVQSRGSPGLELRTTVLVHSALTDVNRTFDLKRIVNVEINIS